jgi:hypothetical protein
MTHPPSNSTESAEAHPALGHGLDCRLSIDVPPGCTEARLLGIIGTGIDAVEKLSGKRRQWTMATQIEPTPKVRRPRKPTLATLIKRAEKTGKHVTSITTPDGITFTFGKATDANNPWDVAAAALRQKKEQLQ